VKYNMIIKSKRQNGYGLIEIIAGLALVGILTTGIATFAVQTMTEGARTDNRMQALMQVENTGFWVSRDVQMAENLTLGENAGFPLQLFWEDIDQNEYQVTYNITDGQIKRNLVQNDEESVQTLIAKDINSAPSLTNLSYTGGLLILNVTSTFANVDASRSYQIKKRLDLE
jgi:prepilin-type N-terminal cleavage/methylation domain-containing protein